VSPEVRYCLPTESGCWYDPGNKDLDQGEPEKVVVIDQAYIETNTPAVTDRLAKAGGPTRGSPEPCARALSNARRWTYGSTVSR
jgi:hypothetical protein